MSSKNSEIKYKNVPRSILKDYCDADEFINFNEEDPDLDTIIVPLPKTPRWDKIDNFGLPKEEQKFQRQIIPIKIIELQEAQHDDGEFLTQDEIWDRIETDYEYYKEEIKWIKLQWKRIIGGYWFFNNGKATYIDGWHYAYLNFFELDIGLPEYRDRDRRFFHFARFCKLDPSCFGFIYPKHRREGATYKTSCIHYFIISTLIRARGGIQSMTDDSGRDVFQKHIVDPWSQMPFFLRPNHDGGDNPKAKLRFYPSSSRGKAGIKKRSKKSLRSEIEYRASSELSFDGTKLFFYHHEEVGKCFRPDTLVLMANGDKKPIKDIQIGEYVMGNDSTPRKVLNKTNGIGQMYDVKPKKWAGYSVNENHTIHGVSSGQKMLSSTNKETGAVDKSVLEYLNMSKTAKAHYMLYKTGVEYPEINHILEPYYLGIWLGDGSHNGTTIHKPNQQIEEYVKGLCERMSLKYTLTGKKGDKFGHNLTKTKGKYNPIIDEFRRLNIFENKHIPKEYLIDSRKNRLELLAGLLDTDGSLNKKPNGGGHYEITQVRKQLAEQIKELAESLGFYASLNEKIVTTKYGYNGTYYRVCIFGDIDSIPCKTPHKIAEKAPVYNRKNPLRTSFSVEKSYIGEYCGIEIDGNNLFVLGDYQVVHNCKDVNINKRWEVVQLTLSTGGNSRIHGFSIHTSTVGEMDAGGGQQFRELCDSSMYGQRNANGQTASGLYILFIPAWDGLEGFVDEYGMSIIDDPTPEQSEFSGKKIGARKFIENTIEHLKTLPKKDKLLQFQREHPTTFRGCFRSNMKSPFFNMQKLEERMDELRFDKKAVIKGDFVWHKDIRFGKVVFEEHENGRFAISKRLAEHEANRISWDASQESYIAHNIYFCGGADPFRADQTKSAKQSLGGGAVYWGHDIRLDPFEKDISLWESCRFICTYLYRPPTTDDFCEDMLKMCWYYGCPMYPETNVEKVREYFTRNDCEGMLVHQLKKGKFDDLGGQQTDERAKQRIWQLLQIQVERHCHRERHIDLLNQIYEIKGIDDMTNYDLFTAAGYAMMGADNYLDDVNKEVIDSAADPMGDYYSQFV